MKRYIFAIAYLALSCFHTTDCLAQTSPNGNITIDTASDGLIVKYRTSKSWQNIMTIATNKASKVSEQKTRKVTYDMLSGKRIHCSNAYKEATYRDSENNIFTIRVYNDGIAWKGCHTSIVNLSQCKNNWLMKWTDSYEGFFPLNREQKESERYGYPALFEYDNSVFALLSESGITKDNAATSIHATHKKNIFTLSPDGTEDGGWQTLIIGSLADVVESTLITDNSEACKIDDTSWIHPGVASWIYWAYNHGSNDISIIRKYIDLAVKLKLPYILIDAEWDEMPKIASNNGKTIEDAVKECIDNGVKPIIWYNSSVGWINGAPGPKFRLNKPEDMEKEFAWCEKIGIKGVKIDFFSGDTNLNIKYMIELLECAAKHHLLVNFHGATIPRGWQRTYPNLISTEGVYGAEWYNNVPTFTDKAAAHNAMLPFTRNVVGSMDYTPCAFSDSQHPHITTHAHELALTVLFESGIQHIADRPESLLAQPEAVKSFFSNLPTTWDETRLLSGYPGESVVIARRKGTTWYIAGINGTNEKQTLLFDAVTKLKKLGKHKLILTDSSNKQNPWNIIEDDFKKDVPVMIECQPRGGFVMVVTK